MSDYQGNIIIKNPAAPAGPFETGAAPGVWKLSEVLPFVRQGIWPTPGIAGPDPYFPYVSLLLSTTSLNNANNNLFVDSSGAFNPISRNGNTTQGSFTPYSTNWSNYFDGNGDYLSVPSNTALAFGTGDFTIEFWIYVTANSGDWFPISSIGAGGFFFGQRAGSGWGYGSTANFWSYNTGTNPVLNTWQHIAISRSGASLRIFVNGSQIGTTQTDSSDWSLATGGTAVGSQGAAYYTTGYISNMRIIKGSALYTANFTVPTSPLTAVSGTSLLTCQSNRFIDNSSNAFTITVNGNTSVTDFGPFSPAYPGAVYNQSDITNWSGYFDGSGDYLQMPSNAAFAFGTGDYTIEGWIYVTVGGLDQRITWFSDDRHNIDLNTSNQIFLYDGAIRTFGTVTVGTWNHFAVSRTGGTVSCYLNGVRGYNASETTNSSTRSMNIAANNAGNGYFNGYISNIRVVKGTGVYSGATITVPTTPLTAISGTSLLTLQNAAFTDNSTNNFVITPNGNVTVTGNSPFNTTGYWSNYFDGSGDYLTIPDSTALNLAGGTFTLEAWVYPNGDYSNYRTMISKRILGGPSASYQIYLRQTSGYFSFYNGSAEFVSSAVPTPNAWNHVAAVYDGTNINLYMNGTRVLQSAATITNVSASIYIGSFPTYDETVIGYLSNVRILKGVQAYTGTTYTVPTAPLTAISGTSLLTCQNGRFIDNSTNAATITPTGNVSAQSFDPFYTATIASNGGSMYFDGSGDWLTVPNRQNLQFGANAFTVEFWANVSTSSGFRGIIGKGGSATGWAVFIDNSNYWAFSIDNLNYAGTVTPIYGAWTHVAFVRSGTTFTLYINGTSVRTQTSSSSFTQTNQLVIGAGRDLTIPYTGYISNLRITAGSALYTANFTPPTAPVNPTPATSLLVNGMNAGIYDGTTINDMETVGNAQVRYFLGNYYAGSFDGSGDYLSTATSAAIALGTSDFTLECWVYPSAYPNDSTLIGVGTTSTGNEITLQIRNGQVASHLYISGSHSDVQFTDLPVSLNTWSHLAISRVSGVLYGFLNGVRSTVTQALTTNFGSSASVTVAPSDRYAGSLSNARITKNVAIYSTATYTVPTSPLTPTSNTAFLTCQNTTFIDNSPNALAITVNGGATAGVTGPFTYTRGNSVFLDATDDCLTFPASPNLALGSAAFTIEAWVYLTTLAGTKPIIECRTSGGSASGYALLVNSTGNLNVYTSGAFLGASSTALSANTWNHVALVRSGTGSNQTTYYINGVASGTITMSGNFTDATSTVTRVGASTTAGELWPGYIDDLRVTRGVARYTSNFTPSNNPFPPY